MAQRPSSFERSIEFPIGLVPIFAMLLAIMIMGPSRLWSDRYLLWPFDCFQRHFNVGSTNDVETR